jgi:CBS domain-containing protein
MKTAVKDVMTTRVVSVRKDTSFKEMAAALRENRVSAFPVTDDDGKVIGVVSEADLLTKQALDGGYDGMPGMITGLLRHKEQGKARGMTAGDLMTGPAVTVVPGDTVEDAARLMYKRKVKRLPVIDTDGRLAGIISRADVLSVFDRPDAEIRKEITGNVLVDEFLIEPDSLTATVKDGVVTLTGLPETNEVGHQIVHQVRHVQGVVAVRDRLSYRPPESSDSPVLARSTGR